MRACFLVASSFFAVLFIIVGVTARSAEAGHNVSCNGQHVRWHEGQATFDYRQGIASTSWRNEIIYANATWDRHAEFDFVADVTSDNDWGAMFNPYSTTPAAAWVYTLRADCSRIVEVDTVFNTAFDWQVCSSESACPDDVYDVRSGAIHEFGHWLQLGHSHWPWNRDCVMWPQQYDRTLCDHDIEAIQNIYGES